MLTTNLLLPEGKKAAALQEMRRMVRFFTALAVVVLVSATVLLFPPFVYVTGEEGAYMDLLDSEKEFASRNRVPDTLLTVREAAKMLEGVRTFATSPPAAAALLEVFFRQTSGIDVSAFGIKKDGAVSVVALARTRADLLSFEKSLRDSGWFESFTIPLASLIQEQDIRFTVAASLKPGYRFRQ